METIVIIEDDESIREMLRYYFRSVGYEVACFESGEDYFEKAGEVKVPQDIGVMACKAGLMVRQAISSYTGRDVETAHAVVNLDDEVDELFRKIKGDLINQVADNLDEADLSIDFIIIAKYLERIADHAVNIAQWAIFCVTGEL